MDDLKEHKASLPPEGRPLVGGHNPFNPHPHTPHGHHLHMHYGGASYEYNGTHHRLGYEKGGARLEIGWKAGQHEGGKRRRNGGSHSGGGSQPSQHWLYRGGPTRSLSEKGHQFGRCTRVYFTNWFGPGAVATTGAGMFMPTAQTQFLPNQTIGRAHCFQWEMNGDLKTTTGKGPCFYYGLSSAPTPINETREQVRATTASGESPLCQLWRDYVQFLTVFAFLGIDALELEVQRPPKPLPITDNRSSSSANRADDWGRNMRWKIHGWAGGGNGEFNTTTAGSEGVLATSNAVGSFATLRDTSYFHNFVPGPALEWYSHSATEPDTICCVTEPIQAIEEQLVDDADAVVTWQKTETLDQFSFFAGTTCLTSYGFNLLACNDSPDRTFTFGGLTGPSTALAGMRFRWKIKMTWHTMTAMNFVTAAELQDPVKYESYSTWVSNYMKEQAEEKAKEQAAVDEAAEAVHTAAIKRKKKSEAAPLPSDAELAATFEQL